VLPKHSHLHNYKFSRAETEIYDLIGKFMDKLGMTYIGLGQCYPPPINPRYVWDGSCLDIHNT
jgi:hypothetical protein